MMFVGRLIHGISSGIWFPYWKYVKKYRWLFAKQMQAMADRKQGKSLKYIKLYQYVDNYINLL